LKNNMAKKSRLKMQRRVHFELFKGLNRQWYFYLRGGDGAPMLSSEGYTEKASSLRAVKRLQKLVSKAKIIER